MSAKNWIAQLTVMGALVLFSTLARCGTKDIASLCDIGKSSVPMNGFAVRVRAIYVTDLKHKTILKDRRCVDVVFSVVVDSQVMTDPSVARFDQAVEGVLTDQELRVFAVDLSGIVNWRDRESGHPTFVIRKVSSYRRLHGDWHTAK